MSLPHIETAPGSKVWVTNPDYRTKFVKYAKTADAAAAVTAWRANGKDANLSRCFDGKPDAGERIFGE